MNGREVQYQNFGTERWNFGTIFDQSGIEFRTVIGLCVLFLCVIAEKMNNMLVV